jgi:hypothetical protein
MSDGFVISYTPTTVREWCQSHGSPYRVLIEERDAVTFGPNYGSKPGFGPTSHFRAPEAYVAEVAGAHVLGGIGIVTVAGQVLWDIAACERADRFDLVGGSIVASSRESITVQSARVCDDPIPAGILLQSFFGANYHHWLVEHLPRLLLVERAGIPTDVPLLVDLRVLAVPQLSEAISALTDREVIGLEPDVQYEVTRLYIPSCLYGTGPNLQRGLEVEIGDVTLHREAIDYLRERLAPPRPWPGGRRIYIDRRAKMAPVRLLNGGEVRAVFESFGFETVSPGLLTFAQQRALFGDAEWIAGESGAALTNVLLASSSATMICMQAKRWPLSIYSDLAAYGKQKSLFIVGASSSAGADGRTYQADFAIDTDELRATLESIL